MNGIYTKTLKSDHFNQEFAFYTQPTLDALTEIYVNSQPMQRPNGDNVTVRTKKEFERECRNWYWRKYQKSRRHMKKKGRLFPGDLYNA